MDALESLIENTETDLSNGLDKYEAVSKFSSSYKSIIRGKMFRPAEFVEMLKGLSHVLGLSGLGINECADSRKLLLHISAQVDMFLQSFSGEEMSQLFYVYASFGNEVVSISMPEISIPVLLSHMCLQAELILAEMNPWHISRMMWGLGNLNYRTCDSLLEALVYHISPGIKRGDYHPKSIAALIWALGRLRYTKGPMLLRGLCQEAKKHIHEFTTSDIVRLVWGLSQLRRQHPLSVLYAAHEEVCGRMSEFHCSDLIDLTFAFTRLSFHTGQSYMNRLSSRVLESLSQMSATDLSKLLYSCGVQGYSLGPLESMAKEHFKSRRQEYKIGETVNLLWSLALCDCLDKETFLHGMKQAYSSRCSPSMKVQIYQCILHLDVFEESITRAMVSSSFTDECRRSWVSEKSKQHCVKAKDEILSTLESMGYICDKAASLRDGVFVVCLIRNGECESVVLEVFHSMHYFVNNRNLLLPTREWPLQIYRTMGHKVLTVREEQWTQVPKRSRSSHLQVKLEQMFVPQTT